MGQPKSKIARSSKKSSPVKAKTVSKVAKKSQDLITAQSKINELMLEVGEILESNWDVFRLQLNYTRGSNCEFKSVVRVFEPEISSSSMISHNTLEVPCKNPTIKNVSMQVLSSCGDYEEWCESYEAFDHIKKLDSDYSNKRTEISEASGACEYDLDGNEVPTLYEINCLIEDEPIKIELKPKLAFGDLGFDIQLKHKTNTLNSTGIPSRVILKAN